MSRGIRPFYFPTTVAIVDDSPDFLANLSLNLDPMLAFRVFDSPAETLAALNREQASTPGPERFFSVYQHREEHSFDHHVIDLNMARIHREVFNDKRFERYSVVVVDYDMPEIDGLEFCRRLAHSPVRKVLLTGKADEKVAVQAFNEGIIDRFVLKQDPNAMTLLQQTIREMQEDYFQDIERMMEDALNIGPLHFLRDPFFSELFRKICAELNIVEFYLCSSPDGILLFDGTGAVTLLLVCNDEAMRVHYDVAFDNAAPAALLDELIKGNIVPYFWRSRGLYSRQYFDWRSYVYPALECNGLQRYRYALVKDTRGLLLSPVFSYHDYLRQLDEAGRDRSRA
ncbi:MAG: response regulator [Betaproteobacteria bacterium]|nr:response regulator [Betaproteobacteria bacterium]